MSYTSLFKFLICYAKDPNFNPCYSDPFDGSDVLQYCLNGIICQTDVNEGTDLWSVPFFISSLIFRIFNNSLSYKALLLLFLWTSGISSFAQGPLVDKKGVARFYSEAPVENIEAINDKAVGAIDLSNGSVAVSMLMKDFEFEKSLMQEHFNENYVESDKYPKSTFKGKIIDFEKNDLTKPGSYVLMVSGELTIHGVTNPLETEIQCQVSSDSISVKTKFIVAVAKFKIDIPKIVFYNIAEEVEVTSSFNFITSPK